MQNEPSARPAEGKVVVDAADLEDLVKAMASLEREFDVLTDELRTVFAARETKEPSNG
jgi:hypothetical protein